MFSIFNNEAIAIAYYQSENSVILALFKVILYFLSFLLVIFFAFYFTKLIAKKTSNMTKSNNMKVLDFITISSNSKILIVDIIDNIYVLSINNNQVTVIDKLTKDDIDIDIDSLKVHFEQKSFNNYLEDILENTKKLKIKASRSKFLKFGEHIKSKHDISPKDIHEDKEWEYEKERFIYDTSFFVFYFFL